jgi:hypothetical protein
VLGHQVERTAVLGHQVERTAVLGHQVGNVKPPLARKARGGSGFPVRAGGGGSDRGLSPVRA